MTDTSLLHSKPPGFVVCRGLRYALPYETVSRPTAIKEQFVGQSLADTLGQMYRKQRGQQPLEESIDYWKGELVAGRVEIRRRKTSRDDPWQWHVAAVDTLVTPQCSIRLRRHVHEKVVPALSSLCVLKETTQYIVVAKPAGVATVDETGGQGVNALSTMLQEQLNDNKNDATTKSTTKKLTAAHRLDKPVSGVLLWGKSPSQAAKLLRTMQSDPHVRKIYIARCCATSNAEDFPKDPFTVTVDLEWVEKHRRSVPCTAARTEQRRVGREAHWQGQAQRRAAKKRKAKTLQKSGTAMSHDDNIDVVDVDDNATKPTTHTTRFRRLGETLPDGTILVECQPWTGYRHQIRAHLAHVGWPIANDADYGGNHSMDDQQTASSRRQAAYVDDDQGTLHRTLLDSAVQREWCPKCTWTRRMLLDGLDSQSNKNARNHDWKPIVVEGGIWLHSYRYVLPSADIDVTAPLPDWAAHATTFLDPNGYVQ